METKRVTDIRLKNETVHGAVLAVYDDQIELEGYGLLPLAADFHSLPVRSDRHTLPVPPRAPSPFSGGCQSHVLFPWSDLPPAQKGDGARGGTGSV